MIPGMRGLDPKRMNAMMKRLGIKVEELRDVVEVVIKLKDRAIVIRSPEVTVMDMQGQKTYQVMGEGEVMEGAEALTDAKSGGGEGEGGIVIPEEDVEMVAQQAGVSKEEARKALRECGGDIAEAIIKLMGG